MSEFRVGIDIGGTFTDIIFVRNGRMTKAKVPSTPADYSEAIVGALDEYLARESVTGDQVQEIVHATTVATNAILERKGAKTALITTEGFRDVLELRRIRIPMLYDPWWEKPPPLVDRAVRFEVPERLDARGATVTALDATALPSIVAEMIRTKIESIAVCFLHSYRNAGHERQVAEILRRSLPDLHLSLSSEVLPEIQEFERTSTTVVNAYVAPMIEKYLNALQTALLRRDVRVPLLIMQSNGGLITAGTVKRRPVTIIESGPAAGIVAAAKRAEASGYSEIITLDMGGTTTKASLIEGGEILRAAEYEVGAPVSVSSRLMRGSGYLLRIPSIDVSEVGAGGGSIATIDPYGGLRVGPQSAGAVPGPVCYGRGNENPTVTDANLILGYLNPVALVGGALPIDRALAAAAIQEKIAAPLGLSLLEAAHGIHMIANSNMVRAIKSVSVERGRDPSDFVMMAFGGNGPVHAAGLAQLLDIHRVIVPPAPGLFSAVGLLQAEIEHHATRTVLTNTQTADFAAIQGVLDEMRSDLLARVQEEGYSEEQVVYSSLADLRYAGQSSEIAIPLPSYHITAELLRAAENAFEIEFERTYGHRKDQKNFELVNCRLVATVHRAHELNVEWGKDGSENRAPAARDVYFGAELGTVSAPVISRTALDSKPRQGPLIVEEYDSTIVVPPGCRASLDRYANVVIDLG